MTKDALDEATIDDGTLASITDNEVLVVLVRDAYMRKRVVDAQKIERRLRELGEAKESASDPADVTSSDRERVLHWLARERTKLAPDVGLAQKLEDRVRALDDEQRAADPPDVSSSEPRDLLRWIEREKAAYAPDVAVVATLEARFVALREKARAAAPIQAYIAELEARVSALEKK